MYSRYLEAPNRASFSCLSPGNTKSFVPRSRAKPPSNLGNFIFVRCRLFFDKNPSVNILLRHCREYKLTRGIRNCKFILKSYRSLIDELLRGAKYWNNNFALPIANVQDCQKISRSYLLENIIVKASRTTGCYPIILIRLGRISFRID